MALLSWSLSIHVRSICSGQPRSFPHSHAASATGTGGFRLSMSGAWGLLSPTLSPLLAQRALLKDVADALDAAMAAAGRSCADAAKAALLECVAT